MIKKNPDKATMRQEAPRLFFSGQGRPAAGGSPNSHGGDEGRPQCRKRSDLRQPRQTVGVLPPAAAGL